MVRHRRRSGRRARRGARVAPRTVVSASNLAFVFARFPPLVVAGNGRPGARSWPRLSCRPPQPELLPPPSPTCPSRSTSRAMSARFSRSRPAASSRRPSESGGCARRSWSAATRGDLEVLGRTARSLAEAGARDRPGPGGPSPGLWSRRPGSAARRRAPDRGRAGHQGELPAALDPARPVDAWSPPARGCTRWGAPGSGFPEGGGRLPLESREPLVLDLWEGNTEGLTLDERRALAVAALMIAVAEPASRA